MLEIKWILLFCEKCEVETVHICEYWTTTGGLPQTILRTFRVAVRCQTCGNFRP